MATGELGAIGEARLVIVLGLLLVVALGGDTVARGVAVAHEHIEDILQFDTVLTRAARVVEVEHRSYTVVDVVLVIRAGAQVCRSLLRLVVGAQQVIGHVSVGFVLVTVIGAQQHREVLSARQRPGLGAE